MKIVARNEGHLVERNSNELDLTKPIKRTNRKGFYINIDETLHKKLKAFSVLNDITMGEVIELLIDQYITF